MKYVVLAVFSLLAGTTIGIGTTVSEFGGVTERFEPWADGTEPSHVRTSTADKQPQIVDRIVGSKVLVEEGELYNFGEMQRKGKLSHDFIFRNVGTAPLHLREEGTSCSACTFVSFSNATVQPGESFPIKIQWEAKQNESEFRKEAFIATSDPERPLVTLVIEGTVTTSLRILPPELVFNQAPANAVVSGNIHVFYYKVKDFKIEDISFQFQDIAKFFEVSQAPITNKELIDGANADGGVILNVKVKPGLQLGAFRQTIHFTTNLSGGATQDVFVRGMVTSDISFMGPNFVPKQQELNLGTVKRGTKATLLALIKGDYRENVRFKVVSVRPEKSLRVSLTDPEPYGDSATKVTITVEIPEDAEPVAFLGGVEVENYGKIVLETTHPDVARVSILVRFAVQE